MSRAAGDPSVWSGLLYLVQPVEDGCGTHDPPPNNFTGLALLGIIFAVVGSIHAPPDKVITTEVTKLAISELISGRGQKWRVWFSEWFEFWFVWFEFWLVFCELDILNLLTDPLKRETLQPCTLQ